MHDASLLQLMWLASPALPIGGFSYSECFEAAVDTGLVASEADASRWLRDPLHLSLGRTILPRADVMDGIAVEHEPIPTTVRRRNDSQVMVLDPSPRCTGDQERATSWPAC